MYGNDFPTEPAKEPLNAAETGGVEEAMAHRDRRGGGMEEGGVGEEGRSRGRPEH